jgi:hypothetical protein
MSDSISKEAFLKSLTARIDQHLKFFDTLEKIRWSFTTGFGVGTVLAFFLATADNPSFSRAVAGYLIVVTLGLAAIVAQIRIYALIMVLWKRVLIIQSAEISLLRKQHEISAELADAMHSPRAGVFKSSLLHFFTVGMVSCFAFSVIIGLTTTFFLNKFIFVKWAAIFWGVSATLFLFALSHFGSKRYITAVESAADLTIADNPQTPTKISNEQNT